MNDWFDLVNEAAVFAAILALCAATLGAMWFFTDRLRGPLLPLQRVRQVPWRGSDVLLVFFMAILTPPLVYVTLPRTGSLGATAVASVLISGLTIYGLRQFRMARLSEMGLTLARAAKNFALGSLIWALITPPVLLIAVLLTWLTPPDWVDAHGITRIARELATVSEWIVLLSVTILLSPFMEELLFRGVLLPWQLNGGWEAQASVALAAFCYALLEGPRGPEQSFNPLPAVFVLSMLPIVFWLPFRRRRAASPPETPNPLDAMPADDFMASGARKDIFNFKVENSPALAIFANGLLFAAMHSSVWPSPVPLLLLGMALAWMTYRTSSLVGAITLHALFNAMGAIALLTQTLWQPAN